MKRLPSANSRHSFTDVLQFGALLLFCVPTARVVAQTIAPTEPAVSRREWSASSRWENDLFGGTDRYYTDGVSLSVAHTGPSWMDSLADCVSGSESRRTVSYELGQIMATPSDTERSVPDPDDRPYAGLLYTALSLHLERGNGYHGFKLIAGVVGPWALADETQQAVHRFIGSRTDQGWSYQLHNEPVINLVYEHRRKYRLLGEDPGWAMEGLPLAHVMLGNALTQGQVGAQLRLGYNLPDDFGTTLMRGMGHLPPPRRKGVGHRAGCGFWVHAGSTASLVLHNITLDGNTFRDSPSVDRELFLPAWEVGVGIGNRRLQTAFSYVFWGKEFEGQAEGAEIGALTFSSFF